MTKRMKDERFHGLFLNSAWKYAGYEMLMALLDEREYVNQLRKELAALKTDIADWLLYSESVAEVCTEEVFAEIESEFNLRQSVAMQDKINNEENKINNFPAIPPGWIISFDFKPIKSTAHNYSFHHKDYDGAPDSKDNRCGTASSFNDALIQIRELEQIG